LIVPAGAVALSLVVGAIVIWLTSPLVTRGSFDLMLPFTTYWALIRGSLLSVNALVDTAVQAAPLILVGAVSAAAVGSMLSGSDPIVAVPAVLLVGLLAGALYGFLPGFLKAYTGAHEVVTTIMLNYIAYKIVAWAIIGPLADPASSFARSRDVGNAALPALFNAGGGHEAHLGILLPVVAVPLLWWLLYRSTIGFEIRTVGANPDAARYAGMKPRRLVIFAMTLAGALAGLAGSVQIAGEIHYMTAAYSTNIGFAAITVALLGRAHPFGILFAGLLLGGMQAGARLMQVEAGVPLQMVDLLQGVILFFLTAELIVRRVFRVRAQTGGLVEEVQTVTRTYGGQTTAP
jgi:simple sugar transport system permease protein